MVDMAKQNKTKQKKIIIMARKKFFHFRYFNPVNLRYILCRQNVQLLNNVCIASCLFFVYLLLNKKPK